MVYPEFIVLVFDSNHCHRRTWYEAKFSLMKTADELSPILKIALELRDWIAQHQDGLEIKPVNAIRVPGALFDLAIEYQVGIVHLSSARIYGPAFALIRAQFEAFVRGTWLRLCATPVELNRFVVSDKIKQEFKELIVAIEAHPDFSAKVLSGIHANVWKAMNSYTHAGMLQVTRRMKPGSIEPNYEPAEVAEVIRAAGFFALLALNQIAQMADADEVVQHTHDLLDGTTKDLLA
jgi:hypothetical protein